jgi:hypothetical protein
MEADLKSDKHGLALALIRKRRLAAQKLVVFLIGLAHHLLLWARGWLGKAAPRLSRCGIVRLVQEVWAVPGRIKVQQDQLVRVRLQRAHPRARDTCSGLCSLLATSPILMVLE